MTGTDGGYSIVVVRGPDRGRCVSWRWEIRRNGTVVLSGAPHASRAGALLTARLIVSGLGPLTDPLGRPPQG